MTMTIYRSLQMHAHLWVLISISPRLHPSPISTKMDMELLTLVICASVDSMRLLYCVDCLNVTRNMHFGSLLASQRMHPAQTRKFSMACTQSRMATALAKSRGGRVVKGFENAREWGMYSKFEWTNFLASSCLLTDFLIVSDTAPLSAY
jgi:hypothetical protein